MPTYTFVTQDGKQINKLFSIKDEIPQQIITQDGSVANRVFKTVNFGYAVNDTKKKDLQKRKAQHQEYMQRFGVRDFQPLKGQSQQQIEKDFEKVKYQMQQDLQEKKLKLRKENQEKYQKTKKSFNETVHLYFKDQERKKQEQFEKNKLKV